MKTINNNIGYVVNRNDCILFGKDNRNNLYPIPCGDDDNPYIIAYTSLFGVLLSFELVHVDDLNNISIYECNCRGKLDDDRTKSYNNHVKKLNEIDYEMFYNYISNNINEAILYFNDILDSNSFYYQYYLLKLYKNLYKMNIYREYILDIIKTTDFKYKERLFIYINNINKIEGNY